MNAPRTKLSVQNSSLSDVKPEHSFEAARKYLLMTQNGYVRSRHSHIRQQLFGLAGQGKTLQSPDNAQKDIICHMAGLTKLSYETSCESSMDVLDWAVTDNAFTNHRMLEYTVRYWATHFRKSSMYTANDGLRCSKQFKSLMPESPYLSQIEWSCWTNASSTEAIDMHELALRVRKNVFGDNHACVLQSTIILGSLHQGWNNSTVAAEYFYQAAKTSMVISPKYHTTTITCAIRFLSCVESITSHERTEMITRKIEMLEYVIEAHKHQHGPTSESVIKYLNLLAAIYTEIDEEEHATKIYRELHEIITKKHGKASTEATNVSGKLMVLLRKDQQHVDLGYTVSIFETSDESMDVNDVRRVSMTIQLSETYRLRGEIVLAEETLVLLWSKVTEADRLQSTLETRLAIIDIAIAYATFLGHCNRQEEATTVLICVWSQFEQEVQKWLQVAMRMKTVAVMLKLNGCLHVSLAIFQAV